MNQTLNEIAQFAGKACGTIVKDLAEISQPMTEAFRRGWCDAMQDKPKTKPAPSASNHASESA